jgi:hypothetical protein
MNLESLWSLFETIFGHTGAPDFGEHIHSCFFNHSVKWNVKEKRAVFSQPTLSLSWELRWLSSKLVKKEKINEIERTRVRSSQRVRSTPRATSFKKKKTLSLSSRIRETGM